MSEETPETVKEIEDRICRPLKTTVPLKVLREFKEFCRKECGDVYAIGLQRLLEIREQFILLFPLLSSLNKTIEELRSQIPKPERREVKTFAG